MKWIAFIAAFLVSSASFAALNMIISIAPVPGAQFPAPDLSACNFTLPTAFGHIWYIDPVNGQTENAMTTAGISMSPTVTPHQGDSTHPWNSLQAVFGTGGGGPSIGYAHVLLASGKTAKGPIVGGDEVLLMNGTAAQYGAINIGVFGYSMANSAYVTIAPAPGQMPILTNVAVANVQNLAFEGVTVRSRTPVPGHGHLIYVNSSAAVTKNVIFDHVNISTTDYATEATYTTFADWTANVFGIGGFIIGVAPCTAFTSNHIFLTDSPIQMATPSQLLIQGNEIDNFLDDGIDFEGFKVLIKGNYIHDFINIQNGAHIDGMQGDGNEVFNGDILIDSNKIIETTSPNKPFIPTDSVSGFDAGITVTNNQWSYLSYTNNIVVGKDFPNGVSISGCTNCMVANNTVPDKIIRCTPTNLGTGSMYPNSNIQIKNNLTASISSRFPSGTRAADPVGCLFSNNVIFSGGAGGNTNSFNCNGATIDTNTPGRVDACGDIIDTGGVLSEITAFNDSTYTYNFSLLSTAAARGAGTRALPTPQVDQVGNSMNAPPDVGALQFQQ